MTKLILVRHGETEWNLDERFRGRADVALNERGRQQAELTGKAVCRRWKPAAVYSSPLTRAVVTAGEIAKNCGIEVRPDEGFIDIDYGEWQGLTVDEVRSRWPDELDRWFHEPHTMQPPGGETLDELRSRIMPKLEEMVARHPGETAALVGHTVLNRVILLAVLGLGNDRFWHISQGTCGINEILSLDNGYVLVSMNNTWHLL